MKTILLIFILMFFHVTCIGPTGFKPVPCDPGSTQLRTATVMVKTELGDTCFSACLEEEQTQQTFYADNSGYIEVNCHVPICTEDRVRIKISETLMFKVFKDSTDRTVWIIGGIVEGSLDEWIITFPDSP